MSVRGHEPLQVTVNCHYAERTQAWPVATRLYLPQLRCDFTVAPGQFTATQRVDALIAAQPLRSWRVVRWREGSQGWLKARVVAVRCWRVTATGTRRIGWLIGEDASDGKRRYYWSNFDRNTALVRMVEYAHRRHWVERFHEEAKELLGWDQYQGRLWTGFHRQAVTVMLAYSFLVWLEWQERSSTRRPGPPRGVFSPRPDRRRCSLAALQRSIADWLQAAAI